MDKKMTAYILRYLLKHRFHSKAEMARQFGIGQRAMQKVFENLDNAKAGTIVLDKAILYCACYDISLDAILKAFIKSNGGITAVSENQNNKVACQRLQVDEPIGITKEGQEVYSSMLLFLQNASALVCPRCETWCNPWETGRSVNDMNCYIGKMARSIQSNITNIYTEQVSGP